MAFLTRETRQAEADALAQRIDLAQEIYEQLLYEGIDADAKLEIDILFDALVHDEPL